MSLPAVVSIYDMHLLHLFTTGLNNQTNENIDDDDVIFKIEGEIRKTYHYFVSQAAENMRATPIASAVRNAKVTQEQNNNKRKFHEVIDSLLEFYDFHSFQVSRMEF